MPIPSEKNHLKMPRQLNRNIKLSADDREEIRKMYASGEFSYRQIAKIFEVSHKTIYLVVNDDKYREYLRKASLEKHSQKYYDKDKHKEYMKRTREYRKQLNELNLLKKEN